MSAGSTVSPARQELSTTNGTGTDNDDDHVELDNLDGSTAIPIEEDLMQLARLGEIAAIERLFERGKFDATYKDEQGITPLHVSLDHSEIDRSVTDSMRSGLPSTTTMRCAISSFNLELMSTRKVVMP
jgi:hypothetical protein